MKKKICFVVQRYGLEVNGGAELHCRQLAEKMTDYYDVTVLTTKAIDELNDVHIIRFSVDRIRKQSEFNVINQKFYDGDITSPDDEEEWLDKQGPFVPKLVLYLRTHKDQYDAFIFYTYLYYPTVKGLSEVMDKAIVVPTAHDEPFMKMNMYKKIFTEPRAIFYLTEEEKNLVEEKFCNQNIKSAIGGVGIQLPTNLRKGAFREKYHLDKYIIYVGRIDEGKDCHILFRYFEEYKKRNPSDLKLVLVGKEMIKVPDRDDIVRLGFLNDVDKCEGIIDSEFLILPSKYESLSIVVLEAFALAQSVLVNGECEVLKGHCIKSNGGLYYRGFLEFEGCMNYLLTHEENRIYMGENGKAYVDENYRWEIIVNRLNNLITYIAEGASE